MIKSGGEWISSVELENALMAHPAVAEAAVIAIPDEKWAERPLACVVVREGASVGADELREFLAPQFAKWWLPERIEFVAEIPKTSVGKFRKIALREQFAHEQQPVCRAALLREVDGPFEVADVPEPSADGRVLVRVRAAGVNFADVMIRRGVYPQMPDLPAVTGSEVAGELEDGTRVMALTSGGGGYAEQVAVDAMQVVPLPDHASFAEGAAFLLTFLTAYIPLTRQVRIGPARACSSPRRPAALGQRPSRSRAASALPSWAWSDRRRRSRRACRSARKRRMSTTSCRKTRRST